MFTELGIGNSEIACYHSMHSILSSHLYLKDVKSEVDVIFVMVNISRLSLHISMRWQVLIWLYEYNGKSAETLSSLMLHAE